MSGRDMAEKVYQILNRQVIELKYGFPKTAWKESEHAINLRCFDRGIYTCVPWSASAEKIAEHGFDYIRINFPPRRANKNSIVGQKIVCRMSTAYAKYPVGRLGCQKSTTSLKFVEKGKKIQRCDRYIRFQALTENQREQKDDRPSSV